MKFVSYVFLSFLLMVFNVYYAYYTKHQFYPTILFLVSSKASIIIAANMLLASTLVISNVVKSLYFGSLREAEIEVLIEKAKYSIIDTCLALTIFRNELSSQIFMLFGFLVLMKLLHKLGKSRMEYLEQIAPIPTLMKVRMGILLLSIILVDAAGVYFSVNNILTNGKSVIILFGFEFGLLLNYALNLTVRYVIQVIDGQLENGLSSRGFYILVVDLISEVIKVITYIAFFALICIHYGLPFHLIRDVYAAYFSFQRKLMNFIKYLQLVRNLDSRFPSATIEELENAGDCLVCRERMETGKKLPCGHIFHLDCLKSWLQHQQSCPLCRNDIPPDGSPPAESTQQHAAAEAGLAAAPMENGTGETRNIAYDHQAAHLAMADEATQSTIFAKSQQSNVFPQFFVVVSKEDLCILQFPSQASQIIRTVKQGTVLFISSRLLQADGGHWLRAPDGWIMEEKRISTDNVQYLLMPMIVGSQKKLDRQNSSCLGVAAAQLEVPFSATLSGDDADDISNSRVQQRNGMARHTLDRLEDIRQLQISLQEMTRTMNKLSEKMVFCQRTISKLVQEEVDEAAAMNRKALDTLMKAEEE